VMSRTKVSLIALVAMVVLSSIGAVSASAADEWFVNGSLLKTAAALSTTAKVDEDASLLVPGLGVSILCGGSQLDGESPEIIPGDSGKAKALTFLGCKVTKPLTGCTLKETPEQSIPTLPVNALAVLTTKSPENRVIFTPQTKKTFAEIEFNENNTCGLAGLVPVKGSVTVAAPTGQTEEVAQAIVGLGSVENNSLEIGSGNKAYIDGGKALLTLASGSKWSFHA
jgi:hypothetical protein